MVFSAGSVPAYPVCPRPRRGPDKLGLIAVADARRRRPEVRGASPLAVHPHDGGRPAGRSERETSLMAVTRRAKIVCTMGPATASAERMLGLVEAGMDVARLNFSHGSHEDHRQIYDMVRTAARETGRAVAVLADLQGPKIRLGRFANGPHVW